MAKLSDEEIERIREEYEEIGNVREVAEELGHSPQTVSKYAEDLIKGEPEDDDEPQDMGTEGESTPSGWTAQPPDRTASAPESVSDGEEPDFTTMEYGEFIEWFFEHNGFGVREQFAKNLAQQCDLRKELPDQQGLNHMLQNHKSGIGNANDARMIAESYWAAAQRYLNSRGDTGRQTAQSWPGQWVQGQNGNGQASAGNPGAWVEGPDNGQPRQPGQPPQQSWVGEGPQQGNTTPPGNQGGGQQNPQMQMMQKMMREMRRQQKELMDTVKDVMDEQRSQPSQSGSSRFSEQIDELANAVNAVEDIKGDDAGDQQIQQLQRQMAAIAENLEQVAGGGGETQPRDGGGMEAVIATLASRDDVDPDTLTDIVGAFGVDANPDVRIAELEKEKELAKSKTRKEVVDQMMDGLGEAGENAVSAMFETLVSGSGGGDGAQQGGGGGRQTQPGTQQPQQPQAPQGQGQQQTQQAAQMQSPLREEHARRAQEEQPSEPEPEGNDGPTLNLVGEPGDVDGPPSEALERERQQQESDDDDPEPAVEKRE